MGREAVSLAARLLQSARAKENSREKNRSAKLARLTDDPAGKAFVLDLFDRLFRRKGAPREAEIFRHLVASHGVPKFLKPFDRFLLGIAARFASSFPGAVMPLILDRLRRECGGFILPAAPEKLHAYLAQRKKAGFQVTLNLLGDPASGEEQAARHLDRLVALLQDPAVESLSVSLCSILPPMDVFAFEDRVAAARERLRRIYRAAMANPVPGGDGTRKAKFVCLDVEDYRDFHPTVEAFRLTLAEPEFTDLEAGIVLQAYVPDAHAAQKALTDWARSRVESGGAPIKIRLVKGANLALEKIEAALHGWPQAPYSGKTEVDASFKRLLHHALLPENADVARVGVGSHNLFEIAYALLLSRHHGTTDRVEFEMIEGMANHQARAVREEAGGLVLHTSIVGRAEFPATLGYLVRRLEENTSEEHFLRARFNLAPGTPAWESQKERFLRSCAERERVSLLPDRRQDRSRPEGRRPACGSEGPFINEPATNWTSAANRAWIHEALRRLREAPPMEIPLVIGGETIAGPYPAIGQDPSRPGVVAYTHAMANETQADQTLQAARTAMRGWAKRPIAERRDMLIRAAGIMARERGESIAALVMDAGKTVPEADTEVSRAVDFAHYHARAFDDTEATADLQASPIGTVVVASSWVSPYAGPCGSILAALMAGNVVILKPAPETVFAAWTLVNHLWEAGIPRDVLQFVPAPDNHVGRTFIASALSDAVILTGAPETVRLFQGWKAHPRLHAATSGKNSMILTANADLDLAIKDLLQSAFVRAGQECSSASLAIVEAEVYDAPSFRRQLKDAAASLKVGAAWTPGVVVTPMLHPPSKDLQRALFTIEPGEEWLLEPKMNGRGGFLSSPAIKLGIQPGSWFHRTAFSGPVLGLIRARDLGEAIRIQNEHAFGLTGGIHSLDQREIERWCEEVQVGNAYVNLPITGARVWRQPFGGWKQSAIGPGAKAGGPNHVASLCQWQQQDLPSHQAALRPEVADVLQTMRRWLKQDIEKSVASAAAASFQHFMNVEFGVGHEPSALPGQRDIFRYRPLPRGVLLRLREPFEPLLLAGAVLAAMTTGVKIELSLQRASSLADALGLPVTVETEDELARRLEKDSARYDQLRVPQGTVGEVYRAAARHHLNVIDQPIVANGRIELMHYFREQTISENTHRHGILLNARRS
jgi:RHH-type proline utilization regulon transcriptional repressor/proline dehydrogenase/delta 1-pyrroline-5-carboxylate dehydrogenase